MEEVKVNPRNTHENIKVVESAEFIKMHQGENIARINYLYQMAKRMQGSNPELSHHYIQTLLLIAEKNVIKLDVTLKRTICKKCCVLLTDDNINGVPMKLHRFKRNHVKRITFCPVCKKSRVIIKEMKEEDEEKNSKQENEPKTLLAEKQ
mmetsp:Transcript_52271/g.59743  ORF Transcript_52271/g.59743 Transcript_52271/m.59743 type:complete len:150 (+) Transcript_52271:36-485(+)